MTATGRSVALAACLALAIAPSLRAQDAPGAPGETPSWTAASKEGVGTAMTTESKVWFTLGGGILNEVYYPRVDVADSRTLEFAVSNGKRLLIESRDMRHGIERLDDRSLVFRQTSRDSTGRVKITKTYVTDPDRNTLMMDVTFTGSAGDRLYVLYHPALGNTGYGDTASTENGALVAREGEIASALMSSGGFAETSNGFAGVNDGYEELMLERRLTTKYARAVGGNVVQVARIAGPAHFTLALGFG
jgi:glucoamylase